MDMPVCFVNMSGHAVIVFVRNIHKLYEMKRRDSRKWCLVLDDGSDHMLDAREGTKLASELLKSSEEVVVTSKFREYIVSLVEEHTDQE